MIGTPRTSSPVTGPSSDDLVVLNGIHGATGQYLTPPLRRDEHVERIGAWLTGRGKVAIEVRPGREAPPDPADVGSSGWGVVLPAVAPPRERERVEGALRALEPLLEHRRRQVIEATGSDRRFRIFAGTDGYRPGEDKARFLGRHGLAFGTVDPEAVPLYLLIVGGPELVPFSFQYQLDVPYAVGRVSFASAEEYGRYARSVVAAETGETARPRRFAVLAPETPGDRATERSAASLADPLIRAVATRPEARGWRMDLHRGAEATKERALELVGRTPGEAPAVLFTAGHGMGFDAGDRRQATGQGALICQDWPGPESWRGPLLPRHYLAAADVADGHDCAGQIAFFFACYGGGTPDEDGFPHRARGEGPPAYRPFVSPLPRRLLGHPAGGALAVVAHVDRAWTTSFEWRDAPSPQLGPFEEALARLFAGHPVGWALEPFGRRYAEISAQLNDLLDETRRDRSPESERLGSLWTAAIDARNYVVLGDPAVRVAA